MDLRSQRVLKDLTLSTLCFRAHIDSRSQRASKALTFSKCFRVHLDNPSQRGLKVLNLSKCVSQLILTISHIGR